MNKVDLMNPAEISRYKNLDARG